jgi:hypothetical protein
MRLASCYRPIALLLQEPPKMTDKLWESKKVGHPLVAAPAGLIEERAARANRAVFDEVMARVGRELPRDGDELP